MRSIDYWDTEDGKRNIERAAKELQEKIDQDILDSILKSDKEKAATKAVIRKSRTTDFR